MSKILETSYEHVRIMVEPDDGRFWLLLRDMGVRPDGVSHCIVTFFREGLTDDICNEKLPRPGDDSLDESGDLFE